MANYISDFRKRVNRHGNTAAEKIDFQREKAFETFMNNSPHKVNFIYNKKEQEGVLKNKSQDNSKNEMYLMCRVTEPLKIGTILNIKDEDFIVYYWSQIKNSGYNKYVVLRLSHTYTIGKTSGRGYFFGKEKNIANSTEAGNIKGSTLYLENSNAYTLITPYFGMPEIGTYVKIASMDITQYFTVQGADIVSTPGIAFITLDPTYKRDETPVSPAQKEDYTKEESFWMGG